MSWIKNYASTIIISLVLLIALEVLVRVFWVESAHERRGYSSEVIAQIYGNSQVADYETVLTEQAVGWEYHPFVEYKEAPREGRFNSVSTENIRCNQNGVANCSLATGEKVIWLFGGSTVFGYGAKNNETIAAHLESLMPGYKVVNLGHSSYYSTPERILFNAYLSQGLKPEMAIFIDGLNDYHYFEVPDKSAVSNDIRALWALGFNDDEGPNSISLWQRLKNMLKHSRLVLYLYSTFVNTSLELTPDEYELESDEVLRQVAQRLDYNFKIRSEIGDAVDVRVVNVLQPIPGFGIGHVTSNVPEHLLNLSNHVNSGRGYEILNKDMLSGEGRNFLDLSSLESDDPMFVDSVHYTSPFSMIIAEQLRSYISD